MRSRDAIQGCDPGMRSRDAIQGCDPRGPKRTACTFMLSRPINELAQWHVCVCDAGSLLWLDSVWNPLCSLLKVGSGWLRLRMRGSCCAPVRFVWRVKELEEHRGARSVCSGEQDRVHFKRLPNTAEGPERDYGNALVGPVGRCDAAGGYRSAQAKMTGVLGWCAHSLVHFAGGRNITENITAIRCKHLFLLCWMEEIINNPEQTLF